MCSPFSWLTLQTPSVSRRNARERNRVKQVNCGFTTLRNHIPHLKNKVGRGAGKLIESQIWNRNSNLMLTQGSCLNTYPQSKGGKILLKCT